MSTNSAAIDSESQCQITALFGVVWCAYGHRLVTRKLLYSTSAQ